MFSIPASAGSRCCARSCAARDDAHYVYVADDAFFPYGHHTEEEIVARVVPLMGELIAAHRPDLVVIACNTASTLVMPHLRARYSVPFVGTVPAIKPACAGFEEPNGSRCSAPRARSTRIHPGADPRFRARLRGDAGRLGGVGGARRNRAQRRDGQRRSDILAELHAVFCRRRRGRSRRTDTIVLACTHYPLLLDRLNRLAPWPVDWIDPGARDRATGGQSAWASRPAMTAAPRARMIFTSGQPHRLSEALMPFFGGRVAGLSRPPIFHIFFIYLSPVHPAPVKSQLESRLSLRLMLLVG